MSTLTNPAEARARVLALFEEGFIDGYKITTDSLGRTLIMVYVDDDKDEWSVFFDEPDVDYEGVTP